MHIHQSHALIY